MIKKICYILLLYSTSYFSQDLANGFVYLSDIDSSIQSELRYYSNNNFIGKPIDGYKNDCVILTKQTALALQRIQTELKNQGLSLKIFDAYRPQKAVDHFVRWAKVLSDTLMKKEYYPSVPKSELFIRGYIASKSGHTRGSTVDLTIIDIKTGKELDMGSPYDFFGVQSHPFHENISKTQKENRMLLRKVMLAQNFIPYKNEWWHFTLGNEPFRHQYFNFNIE